MPGQSTLATRSPWPKAIEDKANQSAKGMKSRKASFSIPIVIVTCRRLIITGRRAGVAVPVDFDWLHMPINKAHDCCSVRVESTYKRMPGAAPKTRKLDDENRFDRLLDGTELLTCDSRHG